MLFAVGSLFLVTQTLASVTTPASCGVQKKPYAGPYGIEIPYRAFPERFGPRILSLESVDYFGTTDHFSGRNKKILNEQNFQGLLENQDRGIRDRGLVKKNLKIK